MSNKAMTKEARREFWIDEPFGQVFSSKDECYKMTAGGSRVYHAIEIRRGDIIVGQEEFQELCERLAIDPYTYRDMFDELFPQRSDDGA